MFASNFLKLRRPVFIRLLKQYSTQVGSKEYFDGLIKKNKVVVFMKGNPEAPRCGFSNAIVQIFRMHDVQYDAHDVLQDDKIREGLSQSSQINPGGVSTPSRLPDIDASTGFTHEDELRP